MYQQMTLSTTLFLVKFHLQTELYVGVIAMMTYTNRRVSMNDLVFQVTYAPYTLQTGFKIK